MSDFKKQPKGFATKTVHVGKTSSDPRSDNAIVQPIVTSTISQHLDFNDTKTYDHYRKGNPTRNNLENCLALLDDAKYGLTYSSGMAAQTTIANLLHKGDHLITTYDTFSTASQYFSEVSKNHGIEVDFINMNDLTIVKKSIKPNTKMIWIESPTNPCMTVIDIARLSEVTHKINEKVILVVDNSFMTAYFQRPLELGADIVMYSLSKYVNGHTDVAMGAAITNNHDLYEALKKLQFVLGTIPSPFDCYQVSRGLKTLALRMRQHSENALVVAKFLETHPMIEKVLHPGLKSHPQHELAIKQSYGHSGIFAFFVKGGVNGAKQLIKSTKLILMASSFGGPESLIQVPILMAHGSIPHNVRNEIGIHENLIRISIGLEDADDLIEDLNQALNSIKI